MHSVITLRNIAMCYGCYEEYGFPRIVTASTLAAAEAAKKVYEFSCVGGNLHIVLDDWNIEDCNLEFCRQSITRIRAGSPEKYDDTTPEQVDAEDECLKLLEPMSLDERASSLALWDKFLMPDGNLAP